MISLPTRVLVCGAASWQPALPPALTVERCDTIDAVPEALATWSPDVIVAAVSDVDAERLLSASAWQPVLRDVAMLLVLPSGNDALADRLVAAGVQDVLGVDEASAPTVERLIRFAFLRKRLEREARKAWSTDLDTGLPNRTQLLEHLNQLLALRTRQPASMALLVLRVDGLDPIAAQHGVQGAQVVRRKVAVRLRAAVRASDVVASLGGNEFALLLAKIEAPADAQRVALKLARTLREPFSVLGAAVGVTAHVGIAVHPGDGDEAEPLLRHATTAAVEVQRRRGAPTAAND